MARPVPMSSWRGLVLLMVALTAAQEGSDFSRIPRSQNVDLGLDAVFRCQHRGALSIGWLVDGIPENRLNNSGMFITSGNYRDENNSLVYTLTIFARPEYNGTTVVCVATFLDSPLQRSSPARLTIEDTCGTFTLTTAFTIMPNFGVFADGSEATFRCHHRRSNRIEFEIDGLPVNDSLVKNVSIIRNPLGNGRSAFVLTFEAEEVLDGSVIVCVATFINGCPNQETFPALLLIQGPLSAVTQFRRLTPNQVVYRWTPPPTLDLTDVSQDIVYSIEIYNITCGANDLLSSQYRLNISLYENALLDPQHVYKVVVVPRSNVQGAMNGTTFIEYERFGEVNVSSVLLLENSSGVVIEFGLQFSTDGIHARWYSLLIHSLDAEIPTVLEVDKVMGRVHVLPTRHLWSVSAVAYDCEEHQVDNTVISTHELQRIEVHHSQNRVIITSEVLNGSHTSGMFIVAYSITEDFDLHYSINSRQDNQQRLEAEIQGLSGNAYNISVFSLENGVPFARAAALPKSVDLSNSKGIPASQSTTAVLNCYINNTTSAETACINCAIRNNFDGTCVAIANLKASLLVNSSHGLTEINVNFLNRTFDSNSCGGCIDGVSTNDHVIAVFPYQEHLGIMGPHAIVSQQQPYDNTSVHCPNDLIRIIVPVVTVFISISIILLLTVTIVILFKCKKFPKRKDRYQVPNSSPAGNNGRESSLSSSEKTNPIMNSLNPSQVKETVSTPEQDMRQDMSTYDEQATKKCTLPHTVKKRTDSVENESSRSSQELNSDVTAGFTSNGHSTAKPMQGTREQPVPEGNQPGSEEMVGTANRKLPKVKSAETKYTSHLKKPQSVSNQPRTALGRPIPVDSEVPSNQSLSTTATACFQQPQTSVEVYSTRSDLFHPGPLKETEADESSL